MNPNQFMHQNHILDGLGRFFFQFHAVFGKIWQNRMLVPPLGSWRPLLGEILDPPLYNAINRFFPSGFLKFKYN